MVDCIRLRLLVHTEDGCLAQGPPGPLWLFMILNYFLEFFDEKSLLIPHLLLVMCFVLTKMSKSYYFSSHFYYYLKEPIFQLSEKSTCHAQIFQSKAIVKGSFSFSFLK